jgi:hypothetical protein
MVSLANGMNDGELSRGGTILVMDEFDILNILRTNLSFESTPGSAAMLNVFSI